MTPWQLENLKGAITLADGAIKSLILVNGGAAAGLLTFMGNTHVISSGLHRAMGMFSWGILAAILCALCAYLAQRVVAVGTTPKLEWSFTVPAMVLAVTSAALFGYGIYTAGEALG
jgi:hypothetical protein